MKSRTSFFNITVLRKDLTRFLWVWMAVCAVQVLGALNYLEDDRFLLMSLASDLSTGVTGTAVFALVAVLCLFGDLFSKRLCNGLHALPVRREAWLFTHLTAAVIFWLVPQAMRCTIYFLVLGSEWHVALLWLLGSFVQYLFFLSLAVFCAVCAGSKFATAALFLMFNNVGNICYAVVSVFYEPQLVGLIIPGDPFYLLTPTSFFEMNELIQTRYVDNEFMGLYEYAGMGDCWWYVGVIGAVALLLVVLTVLVYRRRRLECIGELVACAPVRAITWGVLTLFGGISAFAFSMLIGGSIVALLGGLVLGGMIGELILTRGKKRIRRGLIKGTTMAAVVGVSILVVSLDPLGVTKWKPSVDEVESVAVGNYYYPDFFEEDWHESLAYQEPDEVREILRIHDLLIQEGTKVSITAGWEEYDEIYIVYKLTDGTEKVRHYYYPLNSDIGRQVESMWSSPEYLLGYENWEDFLRQDLEVYVESYYESFTLDENQTKEILEALKTDCEKGAVDRYAESTIYVSLSNGKSICITPKCRTTSAWLKENLPEVYGD